MSVCRNALRVVPQLGLVRLPGAVRRFALALCVGLALGAALEVGTPRGRAAEPEAAAGAAAAGAGTEANAGEGAAPSAAARPAVEADLDPRLRSAMDAGDYLLKSLAAGEGEFIYRRDPATGAVDPGYNWLRHAGTVYAMCQLHEATGEARFLAGAELAAAELLKQVRPLSMNGAIHRVLISDPARTGTNRSQGPTVKAGGQALSILALASLDRRAGGNAHRDTVLALGRYLRWASAADGVPRSKYIIARQGFDDWRSAYYPGQCLLAFAVLATDYPDAPDAEANHDALHRIVVALGPSIDVANRIPGDAGRPFDHWLCIAVSVAYPVLDDAALAALSPPGDLWTRDRLLKATARYAGDEWRRQVRIDSQVVDGCFRPLLGSLTPTSIRLEAIQAIGYRLQHLDPPPAEPLADFAHWAVLARRSHAFIMRCQYPRVPDHQPFAADAAAYSHIAGGFRNDANLADPDNASIQIDYCQHAMSALLGGLGMPPVPSRVLRDAAGPAAPAPDTAAD